jgi:hypothetical protein
MISSYAIICLSISSDAPVQCEQSLGVGPTARLRVWFSGEGKQSLDRLIERGLAGVAQYNSDGAAGDDRLDDTLSRSL